MTQRRLAQEHNMTLQSEFASVVVSTTVLEGLARDLDPDIDLVGSLGPFLFRAVVPNSPDVNSPFWVE